MNSLLSRRTAVLLLCFSASAIAIPTRAQTLTVQLGTPPLPPLPLVSHFETWLFHKGTNAPQADWLTAADGSLNADWGSAPGGFGYGDNGITNVPGTTYESTRLPDMQGRYTTFFIRRSFTVDTGIETNRHLLLTMDYDDGFVAYLDGVELQRANTTNGPGSTVTFTQTTGANSHESSCCNSPVNAPTTYDLGAAGARLAAGTHILAVVGLNQAINSSDFHLIADLALEVDADVGAVANNGIYALTSTNHLLLIGTNTVAGSTRLTVNGDDAAFNLVTGAWTNSVTLNPGFNRLFIAALATDGSLLSNLTQDVVYEPATLNVSGTLGGEHFWTNSSEAIHVTGTVTVPSGGKLTIGPDVVVIVSSGASLLAGAGGTIDVQGADTHEVYFLPATSNVWNEIAADGSNAVVLLRHADINRGAVKFRNGAVGLLEDSYVHEFKNGTIPIAGCTSAASVTVRRSHFNVYHETLWQYTPMLVEDSLFENANNPSSDALDFDGAPSGCIIRRSTFRFGPQSNTDAIDIGSVSTATLIEDCLMHDFRNDKGVSIGETSYAITIRNCLMYQNDSGVAVKDDCTAIIQHCTIANCDFGFKNFNKANPASPTGGGHITNSSDNILWDNRTNISLLNGATLVAAYSDFGATNWPGVGNTNADPLFVDAAAGDYRLQPGSPCVGAGTGGGNMGVTLPVGGIPLWVFNLAVITSGSSNVVLSWQENADNENGFLAERSTDRSAWEVVGSAPANTTSFADITGAPGTKYYYRVRATNDAGVSPYSNIASGANRAVVVIAGGNVGGTITEDTCWAENGIFTVTNSVTVPAGVTLIIKPGAQVRFNAGLKMTVNGQLQAIGSATNHIQFTKSGASNWGSLDFINAPLESRIEFADFDSCAGTSIGGHAAEIHVNGGSKVYFNHLIFANTPAQEYISFDGSSFIVENSTFPTYPWATSAPEMLHGVNGINAGGYGIFRSNYFGHTFGFNDTIDFTGGNRPGPILQIIGNVFDGAGDDHLDLDSTDAWIEGNIFLHAHRDPNRTDDAYDTSSAISGGVDFAGQYSEWTILNNLFYDMDHAILAKEGCRFIFVNNTLVHVSKESGSGMTADIAAFNFSDKQLPLPDPARGAGAYIAGNMIWDAPLLVANYGAANETVIFENNLLPLAWTGPGSNNVVTDPLLNLELITTVTGADWQTVKAALTPKPGSPALGTGIGGRDKGGLNPQGLLVFGGPTGTTSATSAALTVAPGGVFNWGTAVPPYLWGYTQYRWRLDDSTWSPEISITNSPTITLSNLSAGPHTIYVTGRNDAGYYQDDPFVYPTNGVFPAHVTASQTWMVGSGDSDGDGMPDDWELAHGFLPNDPADANADADNDGASNLDEYLAGTDPHDPASRLSLAIRAPDPSDVELRVTAISNKTYTVQYRTNLTAGDWVRWQDIPPEATTREIVLTNSLSDPMRFYRLVTPAIP